MKLNIASFYKRHIRVIPGAKSYALAALLVFGLSLLITLLSWHVDRQRIESSKQQQLNLQAGELESDIQNRLKIYEQILRGAAGVFGASENVTRDEWLRFFQQYDLQKNFPGVRGIGYAKHVPASQAAAYEQSIRAEGIFSPEFKIHPAGQRNEYAPITYVTPFTEAGKAVIGFDLLTSSERVEAATQARDTGQVAVSKKINLLNNDQTKEMPVNQSGFAMYVASYNRNTKSNNVEDRRAQLSGYLYAGFLTGNFFNKSLENTKFNSYSAVKIYDGDKAEPSSAIYESDNYGQYADKEKSQPITMNVFGRLWTYQFAGPAETSQQDRQRSTMILIGGITISAAIAGFLFMMMLARARDIAYAKQNEAQQAKDDLLSLASHQLRTPATAVKQYLGMILEGYTGKVDKKQLPALQKAYVSNERQLETINQILYVAKADAGRLSIHKMKFDINELIDDILLELEDTFKENGQSLKFDKETKKLFVNADESSLRMVIENLISNAGKYSYKDAVIKVKTRKYPDGKVRISVKDQGVGIAEEDFNKLFKKFSRIDNDLSLQVGGSGIGLYIDKVLVELHGGKIEVDSKLGEGSTFTISLPAGDESNLTDVPKKDT